MSGFVNSTRPTLDRYKMANIKFKELATAFKSVKENHGCAGVDGVTIESFESDHDSNIALLRDQIDERTYSPFPLLRILVEKGNGESRKLCIPTVRDRIAQTAVLQRIGPVLEKEFEECSFAYRKGRSVKQAVCKIKEYYDQGYHWVVDADIDEFFNKVDHQILLTKLKMYIDDQHIIDLIKLWLNSEVWDGESITKTKIGISQGSPVSPVLANLFLDELDEELMRNNYKIIRFSDDFVILCKNRHEAIEALKLSEDVLQKLLLELDEDDIVSFEHGFKFLGVIFLKDMIMKPFNLKKKRSGIIAYPKPFDIKAYKAGKMEVH